MPNLDSLLEIAKAAALIGGKFLQKNKTKTLEVVFNKGRDIKLQIDADTEKLINNYLNSKSSYSILGEETGPSDQLGDFFWVVDPLDGTYNFLRDIPICCVSIALMQDKQPVLGVIYDFNHEELYSGHKESQAFMNDQVIKVSSLSSKNESTLVTGIPAKSKYDDNEFKNMIDDFQAWKKIRMIGSAAMASVYVAAGKAETYKEDGIFLWDIAAGAAIVNAAGGKTSLQNFKSDYRVDAKFSNKNIK